MSDDISAIILHALMENAEYAEHVLPHLETNYFEHGSQHIAEAIKTHFYKYGHGPSQQELSVVIKNKYGINEYDYDDALDCLKEIATVQVCADDEWLMDSTKDFIQRQSRHQFVLNLIENSSGSKPKPMPSPEEYAKAMTFSFSESIGHDLFRDWQRLHEHLTDADERFPFDLPELNRLTSGGVTRKTLNILLAPTNAGKSLVLCHLASSYIRQGRTVLYLTLEMSDATTAQRISANLLDIEMGKFREMASDQLGAHMGALRRRYKGNLVVREYPALTANVSHFRGLLRDLKRTQKFEPDVVIVDYLNLCGAASLGKSAKGDLYHTVGTIAAELRGLATEQNVVLWTATQTNRQGYKATDIELEHMSESYGVASTADLIFGLSRDATVPDKLLTLRLLKQRNEGISGSRKATFGLDSARMKIFEIDQASQVKEALVAMPPKKVNTFAARVNSRGPKFAIDEKTVAEAVLAII